MGIGIAFVAAVIAKLPVTVLDKNDEQMRKGLDFLESILAKDVKKGKITQGDKKDALGRIRTTKNIKDFGDADCVIEAVSEIPALKREIFSSLSQIAKSNAILASNTSSISITKIAAATNRPENVIGMHFMNPVPVMKLVEVIPGLATSNETERKTVALAEAMGKTVSRSADVPGFIANRLLMPFINEAVVALQENVATKEHIDLTMQLGTNHPMGPLALADHIGLDTCLSIMNVLHSQLGEDKYRPAWLLAKYVDAGWLGKKTGQGFYKYQNLDAINPSRK